MLNNKNSNWSWSVEGQEKPNRDVANAAIIKIILVIDFLVITVRVISNIKWFVNIVATTGISLKGQVASSVQAHLYVMFVLWNLATSAFPNKSQAQ